MRRRLSHGRVSTAVAAPANSSRPICLPLVILEEQLPMCFDPPRDEGSVAADLALASVPTTRLALEELPGRGRLAHVGGVSGLGSLAVHAAVDLVEPTPLSVAELADGRTRTPQVVGPARVGLTGFDRQSESQHGRG